MTISVALTPEEEAKLALLAGGRGVSTDAFVQRVVKEVIEKGLPNSNGGTELAPEGRVGPVELFEAFDSMGVAANIPEEAFHRDNWYR